MLPACTALHVLPSQGLQITGNEPSPLFDHSNPFWDVYQNDSSFVPQANQYTVVDPQALMVHNWTFNKSAWVLRSQVRRGQGAAAGGAPCACRYGSGSEHSLSAFFGFTELL
jgi:hypothetical protein